MSEPSTARQFWIRTPRHGEIVTAELPPRQPGQVLVRTIVSGISRGTECLVFRGEVPDSQRDVMRAPFQEGDFPAPVKYGYASVGEVLETDHDRSDLKGQTVFCLYPHQDRYCVPAAAVTPVPAAVPAGRAILAAHMETSVNAIWDARPTVGDRIVVIGAGVIGLLVAWLCRHVAGATVSVIDVNPAREPVARALGVSFATTPGHDEDADLVIHASGRPEGLIAALSIAGAEATIVDTSWYGTTSVALPLGEAFHSRRLTLKSSQVGRVPPDRATRWTRARRLQLALELLANSTLDVLISGECAFDELPAVMATLSTAGSADGTLCHRVRYGQPRRL
jgi:threonine dehydrogenase-like Zn-dependent dehydrogenase